MSLNGSESWILQQAHKESILTGIQVPITYRLHNWRYTDYLHYFFFLKMQAIYTSITTIQSSGAASSLVSSTKDSAMVHMSPAEAASGTITTPSFKNHHEIPSSRALPYLTAAHVIESQKSRCSGCNSHQWRCRVSKWSSSEVWISQKLQLASRLCCQACCISSCRTCGIPECHRQPFEHRP